MHLQYHPVLTYSVYFTDKSVPDKNLELISGIDRDIIIKLLCRIKMTFSRDSHRDANNPFMTWFIGLLPGGHGSRTSQFLYNGTTDHFLTTPLIINQVLVDLMNGAKNEANPDFDHPEYISLAILETLLIFNDYHFRSIVIEGRKDDHNLLWEMMLMQDINGKNQSSFVRTGAIKQAIFLDFLRHQLKEKYDEFEKSICAIDIPGMLTT